MRMRFDVGQIAGDGLGATLWCVVTCWLVFGNNKHWRNDIATSPVYEPVVCSVAVCTAVQAKQQILVILCGARLHGHLVLIRFFRVLRGLGILMCSPLVRPRSVFLT